MGNNLQSMRSWSTFSLLVSQNTSSPKLVFFLGLVIEPSKEGRLECLPENLPFSASVFVERRQWQWLEVFEAYIPEARASWRSVQWLSQSPSPLRARLTPASSGKLSGLFQPISTPPFFPSLLWKSLSTTPLCGISCCLLSTWSLGLGSCLRFCQLLRGLDSQVWLSCRLGHELLSHGWTQFPAPVACQEVEAETVLNQLWRLATTWAVRTKPLI